MTWNSGPGPTENEKKNGEKKEEDDGGTTINTRAT